ncbi:hypothetical protein C0V75_21490 [Tabrizicola sp. TH137]|nr:hypothetical protein C0V75_21490 [Tabrizicola sp. TH137]
MRAFRPWQGGCQRWLRKASLQDNAACEGFCDRLKTEFIYPHDWWAIAVENGSRPYGIERERAPLLQLLRYMEKRGFRAGA